MPLPKDNPSRWKKGQSGNPNGRPKKVFDATNELRLQMIEVDPKDALGRTNGQIIIGQLIALAKGNSIRACNEILDRLLGKPPQAVAIADLRTMSRDDEIADILASMKVLTQLEESERANGEPVIQ